MNANSHNYTPYFFLSDLARFYEFQPFEFNLQGVHSSYQINPMNRIPKGFHSFTWGPILRDYYVIYYVKKGTGILTVNSKEFKATAGTILITFPGTLVTEYTERTDTWEYYWIHLKSSNLASYLHMIGISENQPVYKGSELKELIPIFEQLKSLNSGSTPATIFQRTALVSQFFGMLFKNAESPTSSSGADNSNSYVSQALQYFDLNLHMKISVNHLAESLGLSRSHFSRLFKQQMGISPQEYIIQLKIKKACDFLLVPHVSISSVATSLGYDQFSFSRIFRQIVGISPSEYQQRNSKLIKNRLY